MKNKNLKKLQTHLKRITTLVTHFPLEILKNLKQKSIKLLIFLILFLGVLFFLFLCWLVHSPSTEPIIFLFVKNVFIGLVSWLQVFFGVNPDKSEAEESNIIEPICENPVKDTFSAPIPEKEVKQQQIVVKNDLTENDNSTDQIYITTTVDNNEDNPNLVNSSPVTKLPITEEIAYGKSLKDKDQNIYNNFKNEEPLTIFWKPVVTENGKIESGIYDSKTQQCLTYSDKVEFNTSKISTLPEVTAIYTKNAISTSPILVNPEGIAQLPEKQEHFISKRTQGPVYAELLAGKNNCNITSCSLDEVWMPNEIKDFYKEKDERNHIVHDPKALIQPKDAYVIMTKMTVQSSNLDENKSGIQEYPCRTPEQYQLVKPNNQRSESFSEHPEGMRGIPYNQKDRPITFLDK